MTTNLTRIALAIAGACLILFALGTSAYADTCSTKSTAGNWGFSYNGVAITSSGAVPINSVGRFTQDAEGAVTGTEVRNLAGAPADETLTGKMTVNSDCTATFEANIFEGGQLVRTSVLAIVFLNKQTEASGVFEKVTLPTDINLPVVITVQAKRL